MKQRFSSHMTLIELTSALFFLMLAMATIMGLFTTAYGMSGEAKQLTRATLLAQDCAALIESSENPRAVLAENGYEVTAEQVLVCEPDDEWKVSVELRPEQTEVGQLVDGNIRVESGGQVLINWPAARYIIRK